MKTILGIALLVTSLSVVAQYAVEGDAAEEILSEGKILLAKPKDPLWHEFVVQFKDKIYVCSVDTRLMVCRRPARAPAKN